MQVELEGQWVGELRGAKSMSPRDLADAAGVSETTARRAERGLPIRLNTARAIGAALGVDVRAIGRNPRPRIT